MASPLNVCISGSGIAGSTLAFWLLRAYPTANITILERAPALRLTGSSVDIRSSAVKIIKQMGVEPEIRKHTTSEEGVQWVTASGKPIATLRASGNPDVQSLTSEYEVHRGELSRILLAPSRDRINLIFNDYVESYSEHDEGIDVTLANSKAVKTYDLLVAADGTGSRIRGMMLNVKPREQIHDEGVHVAYWTVNKDLLEGSRMAKYHNEAGGRAIFVRPDPHPEGRSRVIFMNVRTKAQTEMKARLDQAVKAGNESYMKLLEEQYSDVGWLVPEAMKNMRQSEDFYCSNFAQVRSPRLQVGRVVLLGDAGYATPGMGTSLAIVGAYVLAGELLQRSGDVLAASKAYEDLMQPYVKTQQGDDNAMQYINPQTAWGIYVRDLLLGLVTGLKIDRLFIWAASVLGFKETMLDRMPDYQWPVEKAQ